MFCELRLTHENEVFSVDLFIRKVKDWVTFVFSDTFCYSKPRAFGSSSWHPKGVPALSKQATDTEEKVLPKVRFVPDINLGFTFNPETTEASYYRQKIGGKFLPFVPMGVLDVLVSDSSIEWLRQHVHSIRLGRVTGIVSAENGRSAELNFFATTQTAAEMILDVDASSERIVRIITKAIRKYDISFFGLGGFTSIVTDYGNDVAEAINGLGAYVTSGNSLTTYNSFDMLLQLAEAADYDLTKCAVTIIGGRGSMGIPLARMLSPLVGKIILVGRPGTDLSETVAELDLPNIEWNPSLEDALSESLLVVSVASTTKDMEIDPDWFRMGSIVVDVSRPRTMGDRLASRPDVLVVAGGIYLLPPGAYSTFNFGLHRREVLACMAETIVLGLQGVTHCNHSLGKSLDAEFIMTIGTWAWNHGFRLSRLRGTDDEPVSAERLVEFFQFCALEPGYYEPYVRRLTKTPV